MLSKDYSAEFKQRFADRYADGATITMLQHEFGLTKSTVKLWRERIDQGGVGAIDRPRKNNRYPRDFKLRVVEAYLRSEGDRRALALKHGVRNSAQIRDRAKRRREGGGVMWLMWLMWQHLFGRSGQRLRPASLNPTGVM